MICPEFVAYFKTGYTGGLRGQGPQRHRVEVTFPIELWNKNQQTCDSAPRTILYKTVTTQHKTQLQICILIFGNWTSLIEEILGKKKKNDAKQGDRLMNKQKQYQFSSVQLLSRVPLFATPWITARQASLSITNSRSSLKLTSVESVMPSSHLILCRPLLLLPPIPPSIRVFFQWVNSSIQMVKVLEFQL